MSDRHRRQEQRGIILGIISVASIGLFLCAIYALGHYQANYVKAQEEAAQKREVVAGDRCLPVFGFSSFCFTTDEQSKAEAKTASDDLKAQQDMAEWAKWITLLTGIQVVVGGIGIYYVRESLMESRITSERELRAYLTLVPNFCTSFDETNYCRVETLIQNDGATPAKNIKVSSLVILVNNAGGAQWLPVTEMEPPLDNDRGISLSRGQSFINNRTALRPFSPEEIIAIRNGTAAVGIVVRADYEDVFERAHTERIGATIHADEATLLKLTSNYLPSDLKIRFNRIPNYGEST